MLISDTFAKISYNISIRTLGGVSMSNVSVLLAQEKALSKQEQEELLSQLEAFVVLGSQAKQITKEVKEMRFSKGRVCCHCNGTDSHKSYIQFSADIGLEYKQIRRGRHKEDIYHIQHINSLHSNLKGWMRRFNGVATKYLSNYMKWYKWMGTFSSEKEIIRTKNLLVHSNIPHKYTRVKEFKNIVPNFV